MVGCTAVTLNSLFNVHEVITSRKTKIIYMEYFAGMKGITPLFFIEFCRKNE